MNSPSRRALLLTLGTGATGLVAGCTADSPDSSRTTSTTATDTTTRTPTGTETTTRTPASLDCGVSSAPDADWPRPARDPGNAGFVARDTGPASVPSEQWHVSADDAVGDTEYSPRFHQPVVADGTVIAANPLLAGTSQDTSEEHYLRAFDAADGAERWAVRLADQPTAPAVVGGTVYLATVGSVHAVTAATGRLRWSRAFDSRVAGHQVVAGRVLVATDERLVALTTEGTTAWTTPLAERGWARPAVRHGTVYVGMEGARLAAFDAATGERQWARQLAPVDDEMNTPLVRPVVATDCALFVGVNGRLVALDRSGAVAWRRGESQDNYTTVSSDGESVVAGTGDGWVHRLRAADGTPIWEAFYGAESPRITDGVYAPPVVTGGTVYVFARYDTLVALRTRDGAERWRAERNLNDLVAADGTLFVTTESGHALAALA
jgi:outer membrane protein assembly factor BamB